MQTTHATDTTAGAVTSSGAPRRAGRLVGEGGLATLALVLVTAVWGSSFFLIHDLVGTLPPDDLSAVRFAIAAVAMLAVFGRHLRGLRRADVVAALLIGVVYGLAQILQTYGLAHTEASTSGFLTGLCVVLTPLIALVLWRERLPGATWAAVGLSVLGLAVLCFGGGAGIGGLGPGELLTLASAVAYALQIVGMSRYVEPERANGMAVVMMLGVALTCGVGGVADGRVELPADSGAWLAVVWMALFAGALAMWAQAWAQARMPATRAAIVMTLEPVFAATFALLWGGETLTGRLLVGGGLILSAMLVAELVGARAQESHEDAAVDVTADDVTADSGAAAPADPARA